MFPDGFSLAEITHPLDPLLPGWLRLYELTFPTNERILAGRLLEILQAGPGEQYHFLALLDADRRVAGLAFYEVMPNQPAAYLWYLATQPELRGFGAGGALYDELARRTLAVRGMLIYEVELPEEGASPAEQQLRERRISFYRRHGARRLAGIHYLQVVGSHVPPVPMALLVHGPDDLDPVVVFNTARALFGANLNQVGILLLE